MAFRGALKWRPNARNLLLVCLIDACARSAERSQLRKRFSFVNNREKHCYNEFGNVDFASFGSFKGEGKVAHVLKYHALKT